jgi:protein disulfide isomerase family A protein 3
LSKLQLNDIHIGNADKFKKPLVIAYYDVDYEKNEKGTNYWRNR